MQQELPVRKRNRLQGYDYSLSGTYYLTLCVEGRHNLLGEVDVGAIINCPHTILSDCGKIVEDAIDNIPKHYPQIAVDKYVIMPNHVHIILDVNTEGVHGRLIIAPTTVSSVIKEMKSYVTKQIGFSLWQRSFYDHIIRDEEDYWQKWRYIDENPAKWHEDEFYE